MKRTTSDALHELREILRADAGRFSRYQALPEPVLRQVPGLHGLDYAKDQLPVDATRYDWLRHVLSSVPDRSVDVGASLGYFALSLALELGCRVCAYEPVEEYSRACAIMADLCGVADLVTCTNRAVDLEDVPHLPHADLAIHLNVLHHLATGPAGDLDTASWRSRAVRYLRALRGRSSRLLFQTGNVKGGELLFSSEQTLPFTAAVLEEAGWRIEWIGVVLDFRSYEYTTYERRELDAIPVVTCFRNGESGLVDYYVEGRPVASLPTGLAQRPLWFCTSNGSRDTR